MTTAVMGNQYATVRVLPEGPTKLPAGDNPSITTARLLGFEPDPWQAEILTETARKRPDMTWAAREIGIILARQQGKTAIVVPRAFAGALVYGERRILYSAHEVRTTREVWASFAAAAKLPILERHISRMSISSGREFIEFHNGATIKMVSRTRAAARGFSADLLFLDEAYALDEEQIAAVVPVMSAQPNAQFWMLSSAGSFQARVLLEVRQRAHRIADGREPSEDFAYWEWFEPAGDRADFDDPAVWAQANPAYGRRLHAATVRRERRSMTRQRFGQERLGIWGANAREAELDAERFPHIIADRTFEAPYGSVVAFGVDADWSRASSAIAVAWWSSDGTTPVVQLVDSGPGVALLGARLAELAERFGSPDVGYDKRGGIVDIMASHARNYPQTVLKPLTGDEYVEACQGFKQRVTDTSLTVGVSARLAADMANASRRPWGSGWVFDRRVEEPPTALIAATIAVYRLEHATAGVQVF